MKKIILFTTLLLLSSTMGFADIARPDKTPGPVKKSKSVATSMTIRLDRDAAEPRLLIPKSQIKQLRAELEQMDDESDTTASTTGSVSRTQTIMSGLFLSLAFVFGGIWFVRSGRSATKTGKAVVVLALLAGIGSAATYVYANAGPPPEMRSITGKLFSNRVQSWGRAWGKIRLEVNNGGDNVELIVPNPGDDSKSGDEE